MRDRGRIPWNSNLKMDFWGYYICLYCKNFKSESKFILAQHIYSHHLIIDQKCPLCSEREKVAIARHIYRFHFACQFCLQRICTKSCEKIIRNAIKKHDWSYFNFDKSLFQWFMYWWQTNMLQYCFIIFLKKFKLLKRNI